MCTAQHQGVGARIEQGLHTVAHQACRSRAVEVTRLYRLDPARAGRGHHLVIFGMTLDQRRQVGAAEGCRRRQHADHPAPGVRCGRTDRRLDADDGQSEIFAQGGDRRDRCRVAGHDNRLRPLRLEPGADMHGPLAQILDRAQAVRAMRRIRHIEQRFGRHERGDRAHHGQAAKAGVENSDRRAVRHGLRRRSGAWGPDGPGHPAGTGR